MISTTIMEWFTRFPALFAFAGGTIGVIVSVVIFWLILKKFGPAEKAATGRLMDLQQKQLSTMEATTALQIKAQTDALAMQKGHYDEELHEVRSKAEADVKEARTRADLAEEHLHTKRNEWNNSQLALTVEAEQLRARPDLGTLMDFERKADERNEKFFKEFGTAFTAQGAVLAQVASTLDSVAKALAAHDIRIEEQMTSMLSPLVDGMKEVVLVIKQTGKTRRKKIES